MQPGGPAAGAKVYRRAASDDSVRRAHGAPSAGRVLGRAFLTAADAAVAVGRVTSGGGSRE